MRQIKINKDGNPDFICGGGDVLSMFCNEINKARKFLMLNDEILQIAATIDEGVLTFQVTSHYQERTDEIAFWDEIRNVAELMGGYVEPIQSWDEEDGEYIQQKIVWTVNDMMYEHFEFRIDTLRQMVEPLWIQAGLPIL